MCNASKWSQKGESETQSGNALLTQARKEVGDPKIALVAQLTGVGQRGWTGLHQLRWHSGLPEEAPSQAPGPLPFFFFFRD